MFKKLVLASIIAVSSIAANEDTVSVQVQEAVTINHSLIKDLYKKIEALEKKVEILSENRTVSKNDKKIENQTLAGKEYFVSINGLNIRTSPNINKNNLIGKLYQGEQVTCIEIKNEWCKTIDNNYVWSNGLVKANKKLAVVTKTSNLHKGENTGIVETKKILNKGEVVDEFGKTKKWTVLDGSYLIDSNNIVEAK